MNQQGTVKDGGKDPMARVGSEPDISDLIGELKRSSLDYNGYGGGSQLIDAQDAIRFCRWDGQTADGRKWSAGGPGLTASVGGVTVPVSMSGGGLRQNVFPWEGASDARIAIADEVINANVDLLTTSFWRAMTKVSAVAVDDLSVASTGNQLVDWAKNTQMFSDLTRECELLAQYVQTYGWSGGHVTWCEEGGQKENTITMQQIEEMAAMVPGGTIKELPALIANPASEDQVSEILMSVFPHLKKKRALKAVRDLREYGESSFPIPTVVKSQPVIAALCPIDEISFPPETTNIQSARVVFRRFYMTELEILQKVETDGWDEEWAEAAIQTMGKSSSIALPMPVKSASGIAPLSREHLIEVVYSYQKALDEDDIPGVFCTVFTPQVGDNYAKFESIEYSHGLYPFVVWQTEFLNRKIVESRGVPEICASWQAEAKVQHDSITDFTSLTTVPPIEVPKNRAGNLRLGPAVQLPVLRSGEIKFMAPPAREPSTAFLLLDRIEKEVDRYFGRSTEKVPPVMALMRQQRIVNNWLHGWTDAFRQVLSLQLQYMSPEEIQRVTGSKVDMSQVSDQFDITLKFDIQELHPDLMTEKLKAIQTMVIPMDSAGVIDRSKLIGMVLRAIDPTLAEELVVDRGPAAQKMFEETNEEVGLISLGNPPKLREKDPTAQMRLQFLTQIFQSNPKYQQQLGTDELFKENLKKYAENLQFSVTQQQNAITGRLGVEPN